MVGRFITLLFLTVLPSAGWAQVVFTSPLPFGILQVHTDHADMRLLVASSHPSFWIRLSSDTDASSIDSNWIPVTVHNGTVDTLITVPASLLNYSLYWRTGITSNDTGGVISNLAPGHIIGIAGQSNAVGWVWPPAGQFVAVADGDIRMLTNDTAWQPAAEPTDGVAQGPWIVMADTLYARIGDSLPIGIVNTAVGGTGLTTSVGSGRWKKNSSDTMDTMYPDAIDRFRHAGSELDYFAWIQGEADGESGTLADPNTYREQFSELIQDFETDLADTFSVFHSQISGYSGTVGSGTYIATYPQAREALRILPPSTLVGTALGRSLWDGAFHYTVDTYRAVGRMFAEAVLKERYGIASAGLYPPLMPDTAATLDSITDGSIHGRYCFSIRWTRDGKPATLISVRPEQYFSLAVNTIPFDTSLIGYRISATDPSRVLIYRKDDSITLSGLTWKVTYDATAGGERAPLATIDPISGDTIFATAFFELPVQITQGPPALVGDFQIQSVSPMITTNGMSCELYSTLAQKMSVAVYNALGTPMERFDMHVNEGWQAIHIDLQGFHSGVYWISFTDEQGIRNTKKFIVGP